MEWYYAESGQQRGPVSDADFQGLIRAGKINADTLVWRDGMARWQPYREVAPGAGGVPPTPPGAPATISPPVADVSPDQARRLALSKVSGPSIGLMVTGILGLLAALATLPAVFFNRAGINLLPPEAATNPDVKRAFEMIGPWMGVINIVNLLLMLGISILILMAALRMKSLRSYGLAVAGSVVAMLPCVSFGCVPCCILGLPIGIWALVVLNQPDVKSQFQ